MKPSHPRHHFKIFIFFLTVLLTSSAFGEDVKIGVLFHLTGDLSHFGEMQKNSFMIAFEAFEDQFPTGTTVELVLQDMPVLAEEARSTTEKLISEKGVVMLVGGISSVVAWEVASVAQANKVPFLISAATEDKLTEQGWEYIFRLNPPFSEYGNGMLWFLSEVVKPKTVAILRAKGFTGMLNSAKMMASCENAGYEIVFDHLYSEDETDFRPALRQIKQLKPDVISMASYLNDAVNIITQCKELNINPSLFVGLGGGFTLPQFGEKAGPAADFVFSISVWNPSVPYAGSKEFHEIYMQRYHSQPDFHGAEAYAAMQVVADVLKRAEKIDPESWRKALASTDISSIIGPVKFVSYGKKTQQNRLPTYLVQWINGERKTVWPPRLACDRYVFPFPGWEGR